eukprot:TRINITY_DN11275_c0_g1_i1.p1 TRINITY_DN11275_c0_g1~~TRINITY_DN11275_c0_g1_i1.p1  ORF type:complete len:445 (+),score=96.72 TRINITY_DN11275_c0_g1_i1:25-1359(+)
MSGLVHDFQVVILPGGKGRRMHPLTEDVSKGLLPVANRALVSYPLELLERAGFRDVIIVSRESRLDKVKHYISDVYKGKLNLDLSVVPDYMSGCEILLHIKDKIKSDFVTLPEDLIAEETFVHLMTDIHRAKDAVVTVLLKEKPVTKEKESGAPVENTRDCVGIDHTKQRLVYFNSYAVNDEDSIKVSKALLRKFPNMTLFNNFVDPHFYIFSNWALDVLEKQKDNMSSIRSDLIPYLIRCQYRSALTKDLNIPERQSEAKTMTLAESDPNDRIRCLVYILPAEGPGSQYCARANNLANYMEVNRDIATGQKAYVPVEPESKKAYIATTAKIDPKTQVGTESVVGENTVIGAKAGIKKSVIGKNCNIAANVKIINCVIMDNVTIKEGAKIQNCIICHNASVGENASIVDSQVGANYIVPNKYNGKKEALTKRSDRKGHESDDDD